MLNKNKFNFVLIFIALIISYYVTLRVDAPNYEDKLDRHNSIITNTIEHPYKYRVLNPFITQVYIYIFNLVLPGKASFLVAYAIENFIVFLFLFYSFSKFVGVWFDDTGVIIASLLFAVLIPISLTGYDTLGDVTTAGLMSLGFYFIVTERVKYLFPVVIIGAFNELQIILLILFYLGGKKDNLKSGKTWFNTIFLVITFGLIYIPLYLLRGGVPGTDSTIWLERKDMLFNIYNPNFLLLWLIMIAPLLYFALKDLKSKPEFLKRNLFTVLPFFYVLVFFLLARMREIDKALTIFVILIPLTLFTLLPSHVKQNKPVV